MITWMMGGRKAGPRPRSTTNTSINTFSNIEQGRLVYLFGTTSIHYTTTTNVSFLGGRVDCLVPISNSPITTNSISWKINNLVVMGEIVSVLRPLLNSLFNINSCSIIERVRVAGLLVNRSTSIKIFSIITRGRVPGQNLSTSMTSMIAWGRLAGILRPMSKTFTTYTMNWGIVYGLKINMSTTFLTQIHLHTFFFRTFVTFVTTMGWRTSGIKIPRS